ncbi:hypothetical protein OG909_10595 [Streptomyces sp. NBC_01754]|uniref:hypothetical protein n=1 Tax=Streptomyces sp. NBC_01754 TaxID=2975930 RepID=UPI002DDAF533|nr:hypothetical protein [Streptomyces sp. NBC_01754]WSC92705.1 hypothetical protein OG909_10595 [Streptomyces sp. NBC_01754]
MPRLTAAQVSYGSATVVLSALAVLLLSGTDSAAGVAVTGTAALALGLLVALTVALPGRPRAVRAPEATASSPDPHRPAGGGEMPAARTKHVGEHSLRR